LGNNQQELKNYLDNFKEVYPDYVYECEFHNNWFLGVPRNKISELPDPKEGVKKILAMKEGELDVYLKLTQELLNIVHDGGISVSDIGVTNSTLLGTYSYGRSDVDMIIYGKENYRKYREIIQNVKHPKLRWRTVDEWKKYFATYNSGLNFSESEFIWHAQRKFSDGLFRETVFSVFGVENENETWFKWGSEKYTPMGTATIKAKVKDEFNGAVRPGYYEVEDSKMIKGVDNVKVSRVVTYARDFMLQAFDGENISASGVLEKVDSLNNNETYYRLVVGYFDSYIERRGHEFIKVDR